MWWIQLECRQSTIEKSLEGNAVIDKDCKSGVIVRCNGARCITANRENGKKN